jgi:hypothetical protein
MNIHSLLAQTVNVGGKTIKGKLQLPGSGGAEPTLGAIISLLVQVVIGLASVVLFLIFIWAGYDFVVSRGDPQKIAAARNKITYGIVGYILLVVAFLIVRIVSQVFGIGQDLFQ